MVENFIFRYNKKELKITDSIFDYDELTSQFISAFGLNKEIKNQLKFFVKGKEITKDEELMDMIKQDDIIEVKNIQEDSNSEEAKSKDNEKSKKDVSLATKELKKDEQKNLKESNKEELQKYLNEILTKKFVDNNQTIEKIISEKSDEKIEILKKEIKDLIEEKIKNIIADKADNEINQKIIDIDTKISQIYKDFTDFKLMKMKKYKNLIEFLDNKQISQDINKNEEADSSQKNEDIENLKDKNNKLKSMIIKLKKEKEDLKEKFLNSPNNKEDSSDVENLRKENEKLNEENSNLKDKIKNLESELNKNVDKIDLKHSSSLSKSRSIQRKYVGKLIIDKKDNVYSFEKIKEDGIIELNLTIKNEGEDILPKNSEIQLMNEIKGLKLEKYNIEDDIEKSGEITVKFKIDLELISLNEDIPIKLKLIDEQKKDIEGAKCKINIKIEKDETKHETKEEIAGDNLLEENDYKELYDYVNEILSIENIGEDMSSFKEKLSNLLQNKKDKYEGIKEKTDYIECLKEDLLEIFQ